MRARRPSRHVFFVGGLWASLGGILALVTSHIGDWYAMTDEMRYERLAISIAQTHSLVPRIHGVDIKSFSQLYPLLISPAFAHGFVPHNVHVAHLMNAWIMASACIPAFLLARRVAGRTVVAYVLAFLSVSIPWLLYAGMLLTEVAAYPVFLWVVLAIQTAVGAPSRRHDLLACGALLLALFARTQLIIVCVVVLPLAVIGYELGCARRVRQGLQRILLVHPVLVAFYLCLAIGAVGLELSGHFSSVFGVYGNYPGEQSIYSHGFSGSLVGHVATFSLGLGVIPFVIGFAWLLAKTVDRESSGERRAFAWVGSISVSVLTLQITAFDLNRGNYVHDRLMFYIAPVLILATLCALVEVAKLRWSLAASATLVVLGFVFGATRTEMWSSRYPINTDNLAAIFFQPAVTATGSFGGARALLAIATIAATGVFAVLTARFGSRFAVVFAALICLELVGTTSYAFARLFSGLGPSYRAVTVDTSGTYDWIDRAVGTGASVTEVPYPTSTDEYVSERDWWDFEFWNKSVDRDVQYPGPDEFEWTGDWFPKIYLQVDPASGAIGNTKGTPYVLHSLQESRFRISGTAILEERGVRLIRAIQPWRLDWLTTSGLYDDGWSEPGKTVRVRVFAVPGQKSALIRNLTITVRAPDDVPERRVTIATDLTRWRGNVSPANMRIGVHLCVPAHGFAEVTLRTPETSAIPPSQRNGFTWNGPGRIGGVLVSEIALADELGSACGALRRSGREPG